MSIFGYSLFPQIQERQGTKHSHFCDLTLLPRRTRWLRRLGDGCWLCKWTFWQFSCQWGCSKNWVDKRGRELVLAKIREAVVEMLLWGSQLMTQESQWLASWVMLATVHCSAEKFPNPTDFTCFMTILFFWLLNGFDIVLKFNWNDFFLYRNISKWAFKQKNDTRSRFPMG